MLNFLKKSNAKSGLALVEPAADFIPYACHYSPETILSKNGELMQVIKVTGFSQEQIGAKQGNLRAEIRRALQEHIPDGSYAIWLHTIRRKKNIALSGSSVLEIPKKIKDEWEEKHRWKESYINEVYLTVIKDGAAIKFKGIKSLIHTISAKHLKRWHAKYLISAEKELSNVVNDIVKVLEPFGVAKLGIQRVGQTYYSEPMRFFSKILSLADASIPLSPVNLSQHLASYKIAFGFNVLEVISQAGKRFASIFTLKEYHELSISALDKFLQMPQEFIVTQTLDFINSKRALEHYYDQAKVLHASRDEAFYENSGLKDILENGLGRPTSFGESQMTIMLLNSDLEGLETDIAKAWSALSKLGMNATRRDLRMEECYWANLPANFSFVTRRKPINTSRFAGMISLSSDSAGKSDGNRWGEAVTLFKTAANTPYFFNFHQGESGHTAIMGPKGSGKKKLLRFLLSEATKFDAKIYYICRNQGAQNFVESLGGKFHTLTKGEVSIHPLALAPTQENFVFLVKWFALISGKELKQLSEKERSLLQQAAKYLLKLPFEQRSLAKLLPGFKRAGAEGLAQMIAKWCEGGGYEPWVRTSSVSIDMNMPIQGFNFEAVSEDLAVLSPLLSCLLHNIENSLDGKPAIIVFDEAWALLNNAVFMPHMAAMLERISAKNGMALFVTENIKNTQNTRIPEEVAKAIVTKIFMPNREASLASKAYKEVWLLNQAEYEKLAGMRSNEQEVMVKTPMDSIVINIDFANMKELALL